MKKIFAVLMLATMLFAVGCGNQAKDAAKDAEQKVEQAADATKDAANKTADEAAKKVDEAKDAAGKAADDAAKKADEMKQDAAAKVDEAKDAAGKAADATKDAANQAADKVDEMAKEMTSMMNVRVIALGGLMPGVSVEDVQSMFGEPTSTEGNVMTFADGLKVVLDTAKKVKSISTTGNAFDTPEGMYVGASEYSLNDNCGPADAVRVANGVAEYEYNGGDKKSVVVYKAQNGVITEITCSLK